jgi:hypothetical protein
LFAQTANLLLLPLPKTLLTPAIASNSRLRVKARKMERGAQEFLRFGKLWGCVPSRASL